MERIFAVWKPKGPTSHDIIEKIRKRTGVERVGHAGTLDPLAEGVLVVGVGREATKKLREYVGKEKEYVATIRLGMTSTTDDEEGIVKQSAKRPPAFELPEASRAGKAQSVTKPTRKEIANVVRSFVGEILQVPPVYSAVKIKGEAAYKRARRGERVLLRPRTVEIKKIKALRYRWPYLTLTVTTGPGVYIRALARDVGRKLGVGGYLAKLVRTRVGEFRQEDALTFALLRGGKT
jgi:tRNA pseudouridine55 synthase